MRRITVCALLMSLLIAGVTSGSLFAQTDFTLLHSFAGQTDDGSYPNGALLSDGSALYGLTSNGGPSNYGTIFSIQTGGSSFTLLHSFSSQSDNGKIAGDSLILDGSTLYGMTFMGGIFNRGTIFSIQTDMSGFTLLHNFSGPPDDGRAPLGTLLLLDDTLHGMTNMAGSAGLGTNLFHPDGSQQLHPPAQFYRRKYQWIVFL